MAQLVGHIAFDSNLCGTIPAIFFEKELLSSTPTFLTIRVVLPAKQGKVGSPIQAVLLFSRQSEFQLTLWLR